MSQFPAPGSPGTFQDPYGQAYAEPRKTSGLAIAALICSLIFFCPLTTLLGIVLGAVALISIGKDPMRKGKGVAVAAIVLGLIFTIAQGVAWTYMYKFGMGYVEFTMRGPDEILKKGFAGDIAGFQAEFHGAGSAQQPDVASKFLNDLQSRYGTFVSAGFDQQSGQQPQSQPGNPAVPFPYVFTFSNKTLKAEVELVFADQSTGGMLKKFGYIYVFDPDLGDLVYPPGATAQPKRSRSGGSSTTTGPNGADDADEADADAAEDGGADASDNGG